MTEQQNEGACEDKGRRVPARAFVFLAVLAAVLALLTALMTPYQLGTNTKETIRGIYDQPSDSVQVVYAGASNMLSALSPMVIYDEHGINGYNCASSNQTPFLSYYLLKDLMQTQSQSIRLVVLDPSIILSSGAKRASWVEKALVNMHESPVKLEAAVDFTFTYEQKLFEELFPLARYHSRWNELTADDFDLLNDVSSSSFSHGEFIRYRANAENPKTADIKSKTNDLITETVDYDEQDLEAMWLEPSLTYLDKMVDYCTEHDIKVLFIKTPRTSWNDKQHDSMQLLADRYGIPYQDLSSEAMMNELDLTYTWDFVDNKHPNIHGSQKISHYIGNYIAQNYPEITPIAPHERIDADLAKYHECQEDGSLLMCDNLSDYLKLIDKDRYRVFATTKCSTFSPFAEASISGQLQALGLTKLIDEEPKTTYIGVLERGNVLLETKGADETLSANGALVGDSIVFDKQKTKKGASFINPITVKSVTPDQKAAPSVSVNGEELCEGNDGIHFVVYNVNSGELVDTSCFSLDDGFKRISDQHAAGKEV